MNNIAVYPGSFDPPHHGHIDVLIEACKIFSKVFILLSVNQGKKEFISLEDKYIMWDKLLHRYNLNENVEIYSNQKDLTVQWMADRNLDYMIRGIRNSRDFDEESILYSVNRKLNRNIRTIFIPTNPFHDINISSSIIRELVKYKVDRSQLMLYTNDIVADYLIEKFYNV